MKDFNDFLSSLSENTLSEILKQASGNTDKIGHSELLTAFILLLEKYHDWVNA